ncbi:MAG: DUF615 domain-containing protein [Deltaproteobacteria bacterium]|nr:DUF615 domain-containing protein [Deltaproteobacteria bacterium]
MKTDEEYKSRTQKKNEDRALQKLGEQLVALSPEQLRHIALEEKLLQAVLAARKIKGHGARRRQMQYIGTIMRTIDPEPIRNALDIIGLADVQKTRAFRKIEMWRDEIIKGNSQVIEEILTTCPDAERPRLAQLARNARKEYEAGKGGKSSRILFRYLKELS